MNNRNHSKGITLIELLVVIVIVGVLAAIAIPGYTSYLQRSRRADAKIALEQLRASEEMWRAEKGIYSTNFTELHNTMSGPDATVGYYTIALVGATNTTFTGTATPIVGSPQVSDGGITIDQNGTKLPAEKWAK